MICGRFGVHDACCCGIGAQRCKKTGRQTLPCIALSSAVSVGDLDRINVRARSDQRAIGRVFSL